MTVEYIKLNFFSNTEKNDIQIFWHALVYQHSMGSMTGCFVNGQCLGGINAILIIQYIVGKFKQYKDSI